METWKVYYEEGLAYSKTVNGARAKGKNLGNAVMYNLIGLSLEGMLTGLIMKEDDLPEHSSISSMLRLLKSSFEVPESFKDESRFYNRFSNLCSLYDAVLPEPNDEDIDRMVIFMEDVKSWVVQTLGVDQKILS